MEPDGGWGWADINSTCRDVEAGVGDLSCRVSDKKERRIQDFQTGLLPALLVVGFLSGLVLMEPDLGTVVVLGLVTGSLLFVGGASLSHLSTLVLCAVPIGLALVLSTEYRRQRLMAFLQPWNDASDTGFQITQSFLAFGSGGLFGVGLGEGKQKLYFLPEAHTDFVLALIGEELGFVGTGVIILLFVLFMIRGFQISTRARVPFGRYLGIGITTLIGVQALINACVVTGLVPTKGLTLPFVSYGGSSLVVSLAGVGMLLSISRDRHAGRGRWNIGVGTGGHVTDDNHYRRRRHRGPSLSGHCLGENFCDGTLQRKFSLLVRVEVLSLGCSHMKDLSWP